MEHTKNLQDPNFQKGVKAYRLMQPQHQNYRSIMTLCKLPTNSKERFMFSLGVKYAENNIK